MRNILYKYNKILIKKNIKILILTVNGRVQFINGKLFQLFHNKFAAINKKVPINSKRPKNFPVIFKRT